MGGVSVGPRWNGTARGGAWSVAQRDHHAAARAPQFRLQTSQELLSRLRRAAAARLLSRPALLRALRQPAEKCLRAAGGLPPQPPGDQDRALLHRLHRPATIIALADTRFLPVWPTGARPRWAGSSASNCTLSSTTAIRSSP